MKISDLEQYLKEIKDSHGDLPLVKFSESDLEFNRIERLDNIVTVEDLIPFDNKLTYVRSDEESKLKQSNKYLNF